MNKHDFVTHYLPLAQKVQEAYKLNPVVILAQAAIESGWGSSHLSKEHCNFFGLTGYGRPNPFWKGATVQLSEKSLLFRKYATVQESFMDYGRLIRTAYRPAAQVSYSPVEFAQRISYSKYISEVNGDDRPAYCNLLVSVSRMIGKEIARTH